MNMRTLPGRPRGARAPGKRAWRSRRGATAVLAAIARLPQRQREVLALKYYLDLSERDVAAILQVSRGTVASSGARALAALARQLREDQ